MSVVIWHNPRCSKSRETLALIEHKGITPEIRLYLKDPPSKEELTEALALMGMPHALGLALMTLSWMRDSRSHGARILWSSSDVMRSNIDFD